MKNSNPVAPAFTLTNFPPEEVYELGTSESPVNAVAPLAAVAHAGLPETIVKTFPSVPLANLVAAPLVPPYIMSPAVVIGLANGVKPKAVVTLDDDNVEKSCNTPERLAPLPEDVR